MYKYKNWDKIIGSFLEWKQNSAAKHPVVGRRGT